MRRLVLAIIMCCLLAPISLALASGEGRTLDDYVDIYDIFVRSWRPVDLADDDIQFFVDRLPTGSEVYMSVDPSGTRTFAFLSGKQFGCIAKIIPAVPGATPELRMHIENCQMSRLRESGKAATNRTHHIVLKPDDSIAKEFDSTVTWTFHHEPEMTVTTASGLELTDIWLIDKLIVNDGGPAMVQYYTVEGVGVVGKRAATVTW